MYVESQISSAMSAFGVEAFAPMESGDAAAVDAAFRRAKTSVDALRADLASLRAEVDAVDADLAAVGRRDAITVDAATPAVRARAPGSGSSLQDL